MKKLLSVLSFAAVGVSVFFAWPALAKNTLPSAPATYVEGEVLVRFSSDLSLSNYEKQLRSVQTKSVQPLPNLDYVLIQSNQFTTQQLMGSFSRMRGVMAVQPNFLYSIQHIQNPDRSLEYTSQEVENDGTQVTPWGVRENGVRADDEAHSNGFTGSGVVVAVVDTGADYNHEDLDANIWDAPGGNCTVLGVVQPCPNHGWDFIDLDNDPLDDHGHGTHVSGTVAAEDNTVGVIGVAPDAQIMAVKVLNSSGSGSTTAIASGIDFARVNGADVINMSIGASSYDAALETAVSNAWDANVVVISAASNDALQEISYPAGFEDSISVAAIQETASQTNPDEDMNTRLAYFSNYGTVDVAAPGRRVNSTLCNCSAYSGGYSGDAWDGTSMASPHVAGAAALILEAHPTFTPNQVRHVLESTATDLGPAGRDQLYGSGLVNAAEATDTLSNNIVLIGNHEITQAGDAPTVHLPVLPPDGTSTVRLLARVMNSSGELMNGVTVTFSTTAGSLGAVSADSYNAVTNANGVAQAVLTAPNTTGTVTVTAAATGYDSASIPVEVSDVLLVSDSADWYLRNTLSWWYRTALEDQNVSFARYDTMRLHPAREQAPSAEYLSKFETIIWTTDELVLPDATQSLLADYLDSGGHLLLSGQDLLYNAEEGNSSDILFTDYLKITPLPDNGTAISYDGDNGGTNVTGTDLFDGITIDLAELNTTGTGPSYISGLLPDWGTLQAGATSLGTYDDVGGENAGAKVSGAYRSVFLPYAFTTVELRDSRSAMIGSLMNFFESNLTLTAAGILATENNNANEITGDSVSDVSVAVTFEAIPTSGYAGVTLTDGSNEVTGSALVDTATVTTIVTGIDASTLDDGEIAVYASHADNPTNFLQSFTGSPAVKSVNSAGHIVFPSITPAAITAAWDAANGIVDHYNLSYGTDETATNLGVVTTSETSATIEQLSSNTTYYFKVQSSDGTTESAYSARVSATTLASVPTKVKAKKQKTNSITVRWNGDGTEYQIRYGTNKKAKNLGKQTTSKKQKKFSNLKPNKAYFFKVRSYNSENLAGQYSAAKKIFTRPAQVAKPHVSGKSASQATITFSRVQRPITKYVIDIDWEGMDWDMVKTKNNTLTLSNLLPTSQYQVRVRAVNKQLKGPWSKTATFTTL